MLRLAVDLRPLLEPFESGVTQYTKALVREFLKRPEDLSLDLFYQARQRKESIHALFPEVRHLPLSNTRFHLRCLLGFPPLPADFFEEKPDLIWIPDRRPFYRSSTPVVMTIHDRVPELFSNTLSFKSRLWHFLFPLKRLLTLCDGVLTPSLTVAQSLKLKIPKAVSYEGASLAAAGVKKLHKGPFFLMISPSDPRKRLEWCARAAVRFPKISFVVLGLKAGEARFAKLKIQARPNLFLLGEVSEEEKAWFLRHATALLALSRYEGFDLPVLEAVRAKCPVILSDISVHRELYKNACFVKTPEDLDLGLFRALQGNVPVPQPRGTYSWEKAAERSLLFFLRVLLNENRKRGGHRNRHDHPHDS
ncbi:MAG: glycosyltransferase [Candidatus Gracilibacteria bacterium]|jgi:glycosyltransferase involved in cell wall biosynthesis